MLLYCYNNKKSNVIYVFSYLFDFILEEAGFANRPQKNNRPNFQYDGLIV